LLLLLLRGHVKLSRSKGEEDRKKHDGVRLLMGNGTDQTEGETEAFGKGQGQKIRCKTTSKQHQPTNKEINKDTDIWQERGR